MQHSIEQWIERINAMKDMCIQAHRLRNEYSDLVEQTYDYNQVKHILEQVQSMAAGIANETITEIKTEMDEWKKMKDPKVTEMVKDLNTLIKDLNKLNIKLYKQGVSYRLHDGFNSDTDAKEVEVQYLKQTVEY